MKSEGEVEEYLANLHIICKARSISKAGFSSLLEKLSYCALIFHLETMVISDLWLIWKLVINRTCFKYIVFILNKEVTFIISPKRSRTRWFQNWLVQWFLLAPHDSWLSLHDGCSWALWGLKCAGRGHSPAFCPPPILKKFFFFKLKILDSSRRRQKGRTKKQRTQEISRKQITGWLTKTQPHLLY